MGPAAGVAIHVEPSHVSPVEHDERAPGKRDRACRTDLRSVTARTGTEIVDGHMNLI